MLHARAEDWRPELGAWELGAVCQGWGPDARAVGMGAKTINQGLGGYTPGAMCHGWETGGPETMFWGCRGCVSGLRVLGGGRTQQA